MPRIKANAEKYACADLSKAIRKRMIDIGLNTNQLAGKLGVSPSTARLWVQKPTEIKVKSLMKVTDILGGLEGVRIDY